MEKEIIRYYIRIAAVFVVILLAALSVALIFIKRPSASVEKQEIKESSSEEFKIKYEDFVVSRNQPVSNESSAQVAEDPLLIIVSEASPLPDDFEPMLTELENGVKFDSRAAVYLKKMFEAAKIDGANLVICSGYRSVDYQMGLFIDKVKRLMEEGKNESTAIRMAKKVVAIPGTSEHHTGLAADIVSLDHSELDEDFANTVEGKWLAENAQEFGFILRYPEGKGDKTGIVFEPWHYRFVGVINAKEIKKRNICLEEYVEMKTAGTV